MKQKLKKDLAITMIHKLCEPALRRSQISAVVQAQDDAEMTYYCKYIANSIV